MPDMAQKACIRCGTDNPTIANYCRQCGAAMVECVRSGAEVTPLMRHWRKLKRGLTRKEVRSILGEPARLVLPRPREREQGTETWTYEYESAKPRSPNLRGTVTFAIEGGLVFWSEPDWSSTPKPD